MFLFLFLKKLVFLKKYLSKVNINSIFIQIIQHLLITIPLLPIPHPLHPVNHSLQSLMSLMTILKNPRHSMITQSTLPTHDIQITCIQSNSHRSTLFSPVSYKKDA
jgi:hypothetical protein